MICNNIITLHSVGPLGDASTDDTLAQTNASFSLLLPGSVLDLTALNAQRKFRDKGNKPGAILGWRLLEHCEFGELQEKKPRRGTDKVWHLNNE